MPDALSPILDRAFRESIELIDEPVDLKGSSGGVWKCSVWPVIAEDGRTEGLGVELREAEPAEGVVDLQRQVAEQMLLSALRERGLAESAEEARRRAAFLAEAGRMLAESVDRTSTLVALTRLALPTLGAWCIVDILEEDNSIRRLGIYHSDPEKQKLAQELQMEWAPEIDDPFGAAPMLQSVETLEISRDIESRLAATPHGTKNVDVLRKLGLGSILTVPLVARGKLLGAITFVSGSPARPYRPEERELAEALTTRAALALDNAQMYEAAVVLRQTAESANRAKTAFLGAMSHELRTPLNAIGGYVDLLDMGLRGPVTEEQHADLARVRSNQQHLTVLITEILNFARIGGGGITYAVTEVNIFDAVRHAVELIDPLFAQRGIVFDAITGDTGAIARADSERVTQILVNLLSNAMKFTPSGGHVGVDCAAAGTVVTICVSDTGIGIAADKLGNIFEPFIQLKEGLADRASGVGLGLAISRDLARAMNGDLTVVSSLGKGSRFTLSLPRWTPAEPEATSAGEESAVAGPRDERGG
jgi:signal transduction histidine kinase